MKAEHTADGKWIISLEPGDSDKSGSRHYREAVERYLNAFDLVFTAASERSEFEFIHCLLRVRGMQDAGWDPYETSLRGIAAMVKLHETIRDSESDRHLQLWIYGHIVESAEPYELLANLLDVAQGGRFHLDRFPRVGGSARRPGRPQTPGEKIDKIVKMAKAAGLPEAASPLSEVWDRELRNAVFHADYSFHGSEVRLLNPYRVYQTEEVLSLVNRALAYHDALAGLNKAHRGSYTEPIKIPVSPGFSYEPEELATVMVKDGRGVIGLKDSWTPEQIAWGRVPFCLARFTPQDAKLHMEDPTRAHFPAEAEATG